MGTYVKNLIDVLHKNNMILNILTHKKYDFNCIEKNLLEIVYRELLLEKKYDSCTFIELCLFDKRLDYQELYELCVMHNCIDSMKRFEAMNINYKNALKIAREFKNDQAIIHVKNILKSKKKIALLNTI